MKSWIRGVAWLVALLVTATGTIVAAPNNVRPSSGTAQTGWTPPPTIISFSSDVQQLSLADVEAGHTTTRLSWQTVGVGPEHVLTLYGYRVNGWEPLRPDETRSLPDSGSTDIVITHPLTFGPPTYSLIITDAAGQTLDQRVLIIPYARPTTSEPPVIDTFTSPVTTLDAAALADGTARLSITWDVRGRPPCSHLIFEQVLESGAVVPVDLPRPNLWVPSAGEGVLAPVQTVSGLPVRLRLRVVDMADGSTLAEQALPPIPVIQGAATATTAATQPPFSAGAAAVPPVKIVSFIAAPETIPRGSAVTVTWDVQNAVSLGVWLAEPDGALAQQAPDPAPQGSWTVAVPESYVDQATFRLFATGSDGNAVESTVVVDIICPYTYFFDHPDEQLSCPLDNAATVQAAFQRFEHGVMLWKADTGDIFVLFDNGLANRFKDSWQGEPIAFNQEPPPGLYKPDRGFGRVWADNPQVRADLGWAVTLEEGYTMRVQQSGDFKYSRLYLTWPDGTIIYIVENTWKQR